MDKNLKKQFTVYDSDTPVTVKHGQGHQTWSSKVNPKQGYKNAKFEKPCFKSVHEKPMVMFLINQETHHLSLLNACASQKHWNI